MPEQANEAFTPGMVNALSRHGVHRTCDCGFILPVYPGKYPRNCPSCGKPIEGRTDDVTPPEPGQPDVE